MARFGFAIDNRVCIGCHACTVACKAEHQTPVGVNRTWVKYIEKGTFPDTRRSFSVQRCNHCDDAPCVEICPVTSLYKRADGIVDFDSDRCIGCAACMQACPYDALHFDPETDTASKCNYCTHRVDSGYEPACVVICPVGAIVSGDLDDDASPLAQLDRTQRVQYPKPEKNTRPKLFYVGGESAAMDPAQAPPSADYLWSGGPLPILPSSLAAAHDEADQDARARRVYDTQAKPIRWGWQVSAYVTTKAAATGIVMIAFLAYLSDPTRQELLSPLAAGLSFVFMALTGALLVADLKRPRRFAYVLLRPQWRSWLVRGAYILTAFGVAVLVSATVSMTELPRATNIAVGAVTSLLAALGAIYTAFLFAQAKGRDYWQNPLLTPAMLVDALVAGAAVLTLVAPLDGSTGLAPDQARAWLGAGVIALAVLVLAELLTAHPTRNAAAAARLITHGRYRELFWGGIVGAGLLLPAALLLFDLPPAGAALLLLAGVALRNHVLVLAPQQVPLS